MLLTWCSAVLGEMNSFSLICALVSPWPMRSTISRSRRVGFENHVVLPFCAQRGETKRAMRSAG